MLNECLMHEIIKMPLCKDEKGDGIELSLELSIGGNYGKFDEKNDEGQNINDHGVSRLDFSCEKQENGGGILDLQKKREIQALRRQEARKKREEKLQKSRGLMNNGGGFLDDKLILEAQKFQTRAEDREIKENDGVSDDLCRKREKNGVKEVENDLNLSLFTEKKQAKVSGFAYPWGLSAYSGAYLNMNGNNGSGVSSIDSGFSNAKNEGGNCSVERSSSVASDYQGTSQRGEINSDAGSHSSIPHPLQNPLAPRTRNTFELLEGNESSSQTEIVPSSSAAQGSNFTKFAPKSDTNCSSENRTSPTSGRLIERPPKPPMKNDNATSLPHMPCVSATGNGPNGKTIRGFLSEVSIMCACHGSSFTPAGFVEHAGCTNVSHPLRHITIIPSTLTYRIH